MTENDASAVNVEMTGANQNSALSDSVGTMSSLSSNLSASAIGCSSPWGPTRMGPRRTWKSARTFRSTSTMYPATSGNSAMITTITTIGMNRGWLRTASISISREELFDGVLRKIQERLGVNSDNQRERHGGGQRDFERRRGGQGRRLFLALLHEHALDDLEVVIDCHRDVQRRDHGQRVVPGLDQREKDVILAEEAGRRQVLHLS